MNKKAKITGKAYLCVSLDAEVVALLRRMLDIKLGSRKALSGTVERFIRDGLERDAAYDSELESIRGRLADLRQKRINGGA